jgi:hypothetical protein
MIVWWSTKLDEQVTSCGRFFHCIGRVYHNDLCLQGGCLSYETMFRCKDKSKSYYNLM